MDIFLLTKGSTPVFFFFFFEAGGGWGVGGDKGIYISQLVL